MYDIIYDFIHNSLFNTTALNGYSFEVLGVVTTLDVWLSHTLSIISIGLLFILAIKVTCWFFKMGAGLFHNI